MFPYSTYNLFLPEVPSLPSHSWPPDSPHPHGSMRVSRSLWL